MFVFVAVVVAVVVWSTQKQERNSDAATTDSSRII